MTIDPDIAEQHLKYHWDLCDALAESACYTDAPTRAWARRTENAARQYWTAAAVFGATLDCRLTWLHHAREIAGQRLLQDLWDGNATSQQIQHVSNLTDEHARLAEAAWSQEWPLPF